MRKQQQATHFDLVFSLYAIFELSFRLFFSADGKLSRVDLYEGGSTRINVDTSLNNHEARPLNFYIINYLFYVSWWFNAG